MGFRFALSISPFTPEMFERGYTYSAGGRTACSVEELQKLYVEHGATEVFARVATKRYDDDKTEHHEREHTLERVLSYAKIAAKLNIPFNPEIGVFRLYSDMEGQTAPDFSEYPEIQRPDKEWNREG